MTNNDIVGKKSIIPNKIIRNKRVNYPLKHTNYKDYNKLIIGHLKMFLMKLRRWVTAKTYIPI